MRDLLTSNSKIKVIIGKVFVTFLSFHFIFYGLFMLEVSNGGLFGRLDQISGLEGQTIDYVILGDSHSNQIREEFIESDKSYVNLSISGSNYVQHYFVLKKALDEGAEIKNIVIPLDPNSFAYFKDRFFQIVLHFWVRVMDYNELLSDENISIYNKAKFARDYVMGTFFPYMFNNDLVVGMFKDHLKIQDPTVEAFQVNLGMNETYDNELMVRYFYKTLDLANENNIGVVIAMYPAADIYFDSFPGVNDYQDNFLEELRKSGEYEFTVADMRNKYSDRQELFSDGHHLTYDERIFRELANMFADSVEGVEESK